MDKDIFVNSSTQKSAKSVHQDGNFFLRSEGGIIQDTFKDNLKHLNDYDSDILKDGAYKNIKDEVFKLEYKISRTEKNIKDIEAEIIAAQNIGDFELAGTLSGRKLILEEELRELANTYNSASISAKISSGFVGGAKDKFSNFRNIFNKLKNKLISLLPEKFSTFTEIKNSIKVLETINKSVDELMSQETPYGETLERYNRLSQYITRANTLQTKISKSIK